MALVLNPYITFDGNAAEAMQFYADVLGGELNVMHFRDVGYDVPGVMHANVITPNGFHIFASDTAPDMPHGHVVGNNMQISLSGDDAETLKGYYAKLSEGGEIIMPMERQVWGDEYGQLIDKFGIFWHVNIAGENS